MYVLFNNNESVCYTNFNISFHDNYSKDDVHDVACTLMISIVKYKGSLGVS